jgi:hypothetical protein
MAVTLINCFPYNTKFSVTANGAAFAAGARVRVPMFARATLAFTADSTVSVSPVAFLPQAAASSVTVITYASHQYMVLAHILYDAPNGVAYLIPNLPCAYMTSFGTAGWYANPAQGAVFVPEVPFHYVNRGMNIPGSPSTMHFVIDATTGAPRLPMAKKAADAVCLVDPSATFGSTACYGVVEATLVPSWAGVLKCASSRANVIMYTNGSSTTLVANQFGMPQQAPALDCISYPGLLNDTDGVTISSYAQYDFLEADISSAPTAGGRQLCATDTMYGCGPGQGACALATTDAGAAYCEISHSSNSGGAPATWNVAVFNGLATGAVAAVLISAGRSTATGNMLPQQPFVVSGLTAASASLSLSIPSLTTVNTFSATLNTTQCTALPWYVLNSAMVQYASVTTWYEPARSTVYVYIFPQTLGGYLPLYGYLPSASGLLPASWSGGKAVTPGTIFTMAGYSIGGGSYILLTSTTSGLLLLFAWAAGNLTPILVGGDNRLALGTPLAVGDLPAYYKTESGAGWGVMAQPTGTASLLYMNGAGAKGYISGGTAMVPITSAQWASAQGMYGYSPFEGTTFASAGATLPNPAAVTPTVTPPAGVTLPPTTPAVVLPGKAAGVPAWGIALIVIALVALVALATTVWYPTIAKKLAPLF